MRGIIFNNKDSIKDFGLYVKTSEISPPSKRQTRVSVPFLNGSYKFSSLYGENTFEDRTLIYTFDLLENSTKELNTIKIELYKWLLGIGECKLYDTSIPNYYFLAECVDIKENDDEEYSLIEVKFIAYPFKIKEELEGNNLWDNFNFNLDYLQERIFNVNGALNGEIYNPGIISVNPLIISSSEINFIFNGVEYLLTIGENRIPNIKLVPGINNFELIGEGTVELRFNSEVL